MIIRHYYGGFFSTLLLIFLIVFFLYKAVYGIIRVIIKAIKYFISIPKKKKQAEDEEKVRLFNEKVDSYHEHVAELVKAYENASSREEKEASHKQLMDFLEEYYNYLK